MKILEPIEFLRKLSGGKKQVFELYMDAEYEAIRSQVEEFLDLPVKRVYYHVVTYSHPDQDNEYWMVGVKYWKEPDEDAIRKQIFVVYEFETENEQLLEFHKKQIETSDVRVQG